MSFPPKRDAIMLTKAFTSNRGTNTHFRYCITIHPERNTYILSPTIILFHFILLQQQKIYQRDNHSTESVLVCLSNVSFVIWCVYTLLSVPTYHHHPCLWRLLDEPINSYPNFLKAPPCAQSHSCWNTWCTPSHFCKCKDR